MHWLELQRYRSDKQTFMTHSHCLLHVWSADKVDDAPNLLAVAYAHSTPCQLQGADREAGNACIPLMLQYGSVRHALSCRSQTLPAACHSSCAAAVPCEAVSGCSSGTLCPYEHCCTISSWCAKIYLLYPSSRAQALARRVLITSTAAFLYINVIHTAMTHQLQ